MKIKLLKIVTFALVLFSQQITGSTTKSGDVLPANTTTLLLTTEPAEDEIVSTSEDVFQDSGATSGGNVTEVFGGTASPLVGVSAKQDAQTEHVGFTVDGVSELIPAADPQHVVRTDDIDGVLVYNERVYEGPVCHEDIVAEEGEIVVSGAPVMDACTAKAWSWTVHVGAGYRSDVTLHSLTVNPKIGEFLVIGAGSSMDELWADQNNPIFTAVVNTAKYLRVLSTTGIFSVMLVSNTPSGFTGNFKLSYKRFGEEVTTPAITPPTSTLPPAVEDAETEISVYVGGLQPVQFGSKQEEFKSAVANMANKFCATKGIVLVEPATSANVILSLITQCDFSWPQSDECVHTNMSVTVITPESNNPENYELTVTHLREMWDTLASSEAGLGRMGVHVYEIPDPDSVMYVWLGVSLGVLLTFLAFLIFVYRMDLFREYSRMRDRTSSAFFHKSSVTSNEPWFPTTHQQIPPFLHSDTGYMDYEPELPASVPKEHPPPNYGPPPSYGPPQGYGGAIRFFANRQNNNFDNPAFEEEEEEEESAHSSKVDNRISSADC